MASGNVGVGTTSPTTALDLFTPTGVLNKIQMGSADVAHGMTTNLATEKFASIEQIGTSGGLKIIGMTEAGATISPIHLISTIGTGSSTVASMRFEATKKSGTDDAAMAATDMAFKFTSKTADFMTILGSGSVGVGTTKPGLNLVIQQQRRNSLRL